ncbi:MAG: sulfatase-like hydrolase/transferase, partial [Pseudomonadota bacterium]
PLAWHNSPWTADRAIDWITQDRDRPFCTWVSFPDPHHPFDCPEPWSRLHDPAEVDLPRHRERTFGGRPWWHEAVLTKEPAGPKENAETRKNYSRIPEQTDEQLREIIANTYGQISLIDHEVGRILIALEQAGLADNTYVIYFSDHGDWLGDHGLILKGPMHYEGLLRVPLLVRGPGVRSAAVTDQPVSTLDLGPTLFDLGGAAALQTQHGSSLRPLLEGEGTRDFALNEWELLPTRAGVALSLRTVRTRTHKMTVDLQSGAGELYDLVADPDEMSNLYDTPNAAPVRAELTAMIETRPDDALPDQVQVGMA